MSSAPGVPAKSGSVYTSSRLFRYGLWALAAALVLILWHALSDTMIAGREKLHTIEGTVVEHRSTETPGGNKVRLRSGGTNRIQGQPEQHTLLRIRQRNGTVAEFSASEWFPTPKAGWDGQLIRVQYDDRNNLYGIEVAGEVIRDVETSRRNRKIDNKKSQPLMVFLIIVGLPLTVLGYVRHITSRPRSLPTPT